MLPKEAVDLDKIKEISSQIREKGASLFTKDRSTIEIKSISSNEIKAKLLELNINTTLINSDTIEIDLKENFTCEAYSSEEWFNKIFPTVHSNNSYKSDILVFFSEGVYLFYDIETKKSIHNGKTELDSFIHEKIEYLKFKNLLKEKANYIGNNEYVYFSNKNGIYHLSTVQEIPQEIGTSTIVGDKFSKFNSTFETKDFFEFLLNEFFRYTKPPKNDIVSIIQNYEFIHSEAERNFSLYLSDFSFEDLKEKFEDDKNKFFSEIKSVVTKIYNSSIALPLSISAALFAVLKIEGEIPLFIIFVTVIGYLLFSVLNHISLWNELVHVKEDIELKSSKLKNIPQTLSEEITKGLKPVKKRLCFVKLIIIFSVIFYIFIIGLTIFFIYSRIFYTNSFPEIVKDKLFYFLV